MPDWAVTSSNLPLRKLWIETGTAAAVRVYEENIRATVAVVVENARAGGVGAGLRGLRASLNRGRHCVSWQTRF